MNKLTMLGDSVFDNKKYIGTEEPDVEDQVRKILDEEFASMDLEFLAEDGAVIERMIKCQIQEFPRILTLVRKYRWKRSFGIDGFAVHELRRRFSEESNCSFEN